MQQSDQIHVPHDVSYNPFRPDTQTLRFGVSGALQQASVRTTRDRSDFNEIEKEQDKRKHRGREIFLTSAVLLAIKQHASTFKLRAGNISIF